MHIIIMIIKVKQILTKSMVLVGHEGIVESLIKKGADVNVKVPHSGWTPLHMAAKNGISLKS